MNLTSIFYSLSFVFLICCNQRDELLNSNPSPHFRADFGFNQNLNMVTFKDKNDVQNFINDYHSNSDKIDGFISFRVKDNVDEKTFNALTLKRINILQKVAAKNNRIKSMAKIRSTANTGLTIEDEYDNESFISDDRFASILNEEGEVVSYSFGNDIVKVDRLAVASRQFNVPKQFKLEKATIEFIDSEKLPRKVNINIGMSWKKPQRYDVDIEAGAYYNGKWGGSKFRVIKN